jgi:4-hydroxybenzoate polyprenyltransferase
MIVLIQLLIKYVFFNKFNVTLSLDNFHFSLLVISTVLIALGGYIINDLNDIKADKINKPPKVFVGRLLTKQKADYLFLIFNFIGLLLGYYISYSIDKISFFAIYIIASLLSYLYSIKLKKMLLIKNLIVSFLVFLSIFIVALYDIVPATNAYNNQGQLEVFNLLFKISIFAFLLTLLREMIKDIEDIEGDKKAGIKSLPIVFSINKTKIIIYAITILTLVSIDYFAINLYIFNAIASLYLLIVVSLPLIYFMVKLYMSKSKREFNKLSKLLKIIMFLGMLTIFVL